MKPALRAACLLFCAGVCSAQTAASLSAFPESAKLEGRWSCTGTFRGGKPHHANVQVERALADKWLRMTEQDVEPATGYTAEYLIGYDPATKRLVELDANNFGAAVYSSEDGWKESTLTMMPGFSMPAAATSTPAGTKGAQPNRFKYQVLPDSQFTIDWSVQRPGEAAWTVADHLLCKREAANGGKLTGQAG